MPNYRIKDLAGQVFGLLTAISPVPRATGSGNARWNCVCSCGGAHIVSVSELTCGRIDHCGCLTKSRVAAAAEARAESRRIDMTGVRVGKLVVVSRASRTHWLCRCDCGAERTAWGTSLRAGHPSSCGCVERAVPIDERLWSRVDKNGPVPPHRPELGPCWVYSNPRGGRGGVLGHCMIHMDDTMVFVHRVAFKLVHGRWPMPCGLHHCDNPPCVKVIDDEHGPAHIFEGTRAENQHDMTAKGRHGQGKKTHCKRGHPFDDENMRISPGGRRRCKACLRDWSNSHYSPEKRHAQHLKKKAQKGTETC